MSKADNEAIVKTLLAAGWVAEPLRRGVSQRVARTREDGSRLVLEDRGKLLWLWIVEADKRRCISLEPTRSAAAFADVIVSLQDGLTGATYLKHYTTLGGVAQVFVVAWEKLEPHWE